MTKSPPNFPEQPTPHIPTNRPPRKANALKPWVWTIVATTFTFFACRTSRAAEVLKELLGETFAGIDSLRPRPHVLVLRPAAMVLGST